MAERWMINAVYTEGDSSEHELGREPHSGDLLILRSITELVKMAMGFGEPTRSQQLKELTEERFPEIAKKFKHSFYEHYGKNLAQQSYNTVLEFQQTLNGDTDKNIHVVSMDTVEGHKLMFTYVRY